MISTSYGSGVGDWPATNLATDAASRLASILGHDHNGNGLQQN